MVECLLPKVCMSDGEGACKRNIARIFKGRLVLFVLFSFWPGIVFPQEPHPIGVVYPKSDEPYRTVFNSIVRGVKQGVDEAVDIYELAGGAVPPDSLEEQTRTKYINPVIVSLGNTNQFVCSEVSDTTKIVVGAILSIPDKACGVHSGITLAPDPEILFKWLIDLHPDVERVSVVYNPDFNSWLIEYAFMAAESMGLRLNAVAVTDVTQAAKEYRALIPSLNFEHAVWLPQDPYATNEKAILSVLLKESWDREFIVFSSNPAHVRQGVLFALYPDYQAMGTRLGEMAAAVIRRPDVKNLTLEPLRDVLIAVNLRTADHLRLDLSNRQISNFDLTFPASR